MEYIQTLCGWGFFEWNIIFIFIFANAIAIRFHRFSMNFHCYRFILKLSRYKAIVLQAIRSSSSCVSSIQLIFSFFVCVYFGLEDSWNDDAIIFYIIFVL